jgi:threonyl-tRNA synthetase
MNEEKLHNMRHTLAHLLGASILKLYPGTKLTLGPAIDNGFYYDVDLPENQSIKEEDLAKIESTMKELLPSWTSFSKETVSKEKALETFEGNEFKNELIAEIDRKGEEITLYTSGDFTDLCRGGHLDNPAKEIASDAFKLERVAGAYWRGSEKNKMLTRVYGIAFESKEKLDAYLKMREEAEKNDHRKLGAELGIFAFDADVGPGLPLWLPNGAVLVEELERLGKETEFLGGYSRVSTPHIAKESMYLKSGHLPYYEDSMFPPMEYEGGKYYLKAMNCPHHHKVFAAEPKSYRDLPLRLAEYGTVYRHEKSGELFGLMRVRSLQMNDAHIYCTPEQFADEFRRVNDMYLHYFKIFGVDKYVMRFSTHDPKRLGEKYVDDPILWKETEDMVRQVLIDSKIPYIEVPNEAAFYGPKIDVQVWSAIGREFTLATNQVDFAVPARFGLTYKDKDGKEKTPLCIHRAPLGTNERFIGFLIEHYGGNFPLWLSPTQVAIVPVREEHGAYAKQLADSFRTTFARALVIESDKSLGARIHEAKKTRAPYVIVVGDKEMNDKLLTIETRAGEKIQMSVEAFMEKISSEIKERK